VTERAVVVIETTETAAAVAALNSKVGGSDREGSGGMETTETAVAVMTMMAAAVAALNGKVGGSDREGDGSISKGTLARK
jgi:hypothetical protein